LDLIKLKKKFEDADSLIIDSNGNFVDDKGFGDCGIFIVLKQVDQPLKYVTFDIDKMGKKKREFESSSILRQSMSSFVSESKNFKGNQEVKRQRESMKVNNPKDKKRQSLEEYNIYNQSQMTSVSKQLHVVNEYKRNEMFGFSDVLYEWSGDVYSNLLQEEMLFARSLLNMPLGNQSSKDYGVLSLIKNVLGTKEMFLAWDLQGPFEYAEIPNTFINEMFKKDFDHFFFSLKHSITAMERIQQRIAKGIFLIC
jgi:hypothetical protein